MDPYNTADHLGGNVARPAPVAPQSSNPYSAPRAAVRDVFEGEEVVLASRLGRLGAVLIDAAIIVVPAIVAAVSLPAYQSYVLRSGAGPAPSAGLSSGASITLMLVGLGLIAFSIMQLVLLYRHGQTVGKKIVGIRIVRPDGSRASFPRLLGLRYFVPGLIGMIPYAGWVFSLVDPLFIFAEDRRTLHDKIADTIVVNT